MSEISSDMAGEAKGKDSQKFRKLVEEYLEGLRSAYSGGGGTEYSGRTALEGLLNDCAELWGKDVQIQQEPEQVKGKAPDFKISRKGMVIGYVETKRLGTDCEEVARSEQIKKYKTLNKNILITNYHDFYWSEGEQGLSLVRKEDLTQSLQKIKIAKLNADSIKDFSARLFLFLDAAPDKIASVKELTEMLATRCQYLRDALKDRFKTQEKDLGEQDAVFAIYKAFKVQISKEITTDEFADVFAQTLGFSLFLARLGAEDDRIVIKLANVKQYIPQSFPLIRELAGYLERFQDKKYFNISWLVEEIVSIINNLDSGEIKKDLNFEHLRQKQLNLSEADMLLLERDPFIYFYENFLSAYDEELRKKRGIYYTPAPVVNFIVRGIDDMLKDKFSLCTGLADRSVTALDFACGTGTFLLETMKQIFDNSNKNIKQKVLDEHIYQNIYGFELLIAPYTLAHMKLSQYLKDEGVPLREGQTLPVYLANTLENFDPTQQANQANFALEKILKEGREVQKIKDKDILVIMGNPPYAGHSLNKGEWISKKIEKYRYIDGKSIGEKNPKWLQDDYVKFICFAEEKMMKAQEGIVGIVTNHSFIDNITFRGMRHSLLKTFDQIYILDLHGNSRRKIESPTGVRDENIFDIMQGVSISFFIKKPGIEKKVYHAEIWGNRETKYRESIKNTYKDIKWKELKNNTLPYFFVPFNYNLYEKYKKFDSVSCIFPVNNVGIVTARDNFSIQFDEETMYKTVKKFVNLKSEEARLHFSLPQDTRDWKVSLAQEDVNKQKISKKFVVPINYRIFDQRYTYYTPNSRGFLCMPRYDVMQHMIKGKNLALISVKQIAEKIYNHAFITETIAESRITLSNKGIAFLFPLYLYRPEKNQKIPHSIKILFGVADPFNGKERIENINPAFRKEIDKKYNEVFSAEQIFFYIYAILHSSHYREKYSEFLRIDFPRIPFPDDKKSFLELSQLGEDLKKTHLLEELPDTSIGYEGEGDHKVTKINFCEQKLYINPKQYFTSVEQETWKFEIGGYQVLHKYLKERKGRELSWEEIEHIKHIVISLTETRRLMKEIDPITKKFI